jgi:hypothetical protein
MSTTGHGTSDYTLKNLFWKLSTGREILLSGVPVQSTCVPTEDDGAAEERIIHSCTGCPKKPTFAGNKDCTPMSPVPEDIGVAAKNT